MYRITLLNPSELTIYCLTPHAFSHFYQCFQYSFISTNFSALSSYSFQVIDVEVKPKKLKPIHSEERFPGTKQRFKNSAQDYMSMI